jgi:hypothetical protein
VFALEVASVGAERLVENCPFGYASWKKKRKKRKRKRKMEVG